MKSKIVPFVALALTSVLLPAAAQAQLRITEVQSSENATGSTNVTHTDWWELSNLGNSPADLTGFRMDDNSALFTSSVALSGVTNVAPGESVVFFEVTGSPSPTVQGFRDWWGLDSSVQIGTYTGSGVGLSSTAAGDQVNIYTSTGTPVDGVSFGLATTGTSFGWNPNTQVFGALSQVGVFGAYAAPVYGDIGSPGVVPEPSTALLAGLSLAGLLIFRRRK